MTRCRLFPSVESAIDPLARREADRSAPFPSRHRERRSQGRPDQSPTAGRRTATGERAGGRRPAAGGAAEPDRSETRIHKVIRLAREQEATQLFATALSGVLFADSVFLMASAMWLGVPIGATMGVGAMLLPLPRTRSWGVLIAITGATLAAGAAVLTDTGLAAVVPFLLVPLLLCLAHCLDRGHRVGPARVSVLSKRTL